LVYCFNKDVTKKGVLFGYGMITFDSRLKLFKIGSLELQL